MAMPSLTAINEQLTRVMNELARLQRAVQGEIEAQNPPADARLTLAEWQAWNARQADADTGDPANDASKAAARQSVAAGNTDTTTRAQAQADKATESKK